MDLLSLLKQFQKITADAEYQERSRAHVMGFARTTISREPQRFTLFASLRILVRTLESGFAIALMGFLLVLAAGGFSGFRKPAGIVGLDPAALRAEAEAIDIQIQLSDLNYSEIAAEEKEGSAIADVVKKATRAISALKDGDKEAAELSATVDDALEFLAE